MDLNAQKELFSVAWVKAVAAVAGFGWAIPHPDEESVDLCLLARGDGLRSWSPRLEVQIKCTAAEPLDSAQPADAFMFPLKRKNYDDLRQVHVYVPRILVVVVVPTDVQDWLNQQPSSLELRHCGYWSSLRGWPESENTATVSVPLSVAQTFDPLQLRGIMQRLTSGGLP
jgi:hypothetical protein